jgi:tRNA G46 methylase TrmB
MTKTTLTQTYFGHEGKLVDKWEQYLEVYRIELSRFVEKEHPVRLLEIGVQNGGSLELWAKYLPPQSKIIGIDIDPKVGQLSFDDNISVFVCT